jgi:hypothetical protein
VTCEDCGEILDPIEVILEYAKFWQRQSAALEHLTKLRKAEYEKADLADLRRWARRVAKDGGIWSCDLQDHTMSWERE